MLDNGKLTFWDVGTYLTIGLFFTIVSFLYSFFIININFSLWIKELKDFSGLLILLAPILFLFTGMFIEPIANWSAKIIEKKVKWLKPRESRNKVKLEGLVKSLLPNENIEIVNKYRYCKAIVDLKFPNSNHDIFLARFGFYRSLTFLMNSLFVLNVFLVSWSFTMFLVNFFIGFMSYQFLRRSQDFRNHMEDTIYYNYLALSMKTAS